MSVSPASSRSSRPPSSPPPDLARIPFPANIAALNRAQTATSSDTSRLATTFVIEGILSFAASMMSIGIFFYAREAFHWDIVQNFLLAVGQGAVYTVSA